MGEPNEAEGLLGPPGPFVGRDPRRRVTEGQGHVLERREVLEEVEALEHEADAPQPDVGQVGARAGADIDAIDR